MNMVWQNLDSYRFTTKLKKYLLQYLSSVFSNAAHQNIPTVLRNPHEVVATPVSSIPSAPKLKPRLGVALHGYPKNTLENTELINLTTPSPL